MKATLESKAIRRDSYLAELRYPQRFGVAFCSKNNECTHVSRVGNVFNVEILLLESECVVTSMVLVVCVDNCKCVPCVGIKER